MKLLTLNNAKTSKGESFGYLTGILHLAPYNLSGKNVCPKASNGCAAACLNTSGFGRYQNVQNARIERTRFFFNDRAAFMAQLEKEIGSLERSAQRKGLRLAIRLNGTSDLPWENYGIMEKFSHIQFYDYTKIAARLLNRVLPPNYHLTFSRSESNEAIAQTVAAAGFNVAVVFDSLPKSFWNKKVVDGDKNDLRFLDGRNVIVGLTEKGRGRWDKTGFVIRNNK